MELPEPRVQIAVHPLATRPGEDAGDAGQFAVEERGQCEAVGDRPMPRASSSTPIPCPPRPHWVAALLGPLAEPLRS